MEGCSAPLVVKFADTQKEKEQKKVQQMQAAILSTIKSTGTPSTGSNLSISPSGAIVSDSMTQLTGANGSVATAASLPINLGLSSSGKSWKCKKNVIENKKKCITNYLLYFSTCKWFSHSAKCNRINIEFIAYN